MDIRIVYHSGASRTVALAEHIADRFKACYLYYRAFAVDTSRFYELPEEEHVDFADVEDIWVKW